MTTNGTLAFITPNTFFRQPRYKDLRLLMLEHKIVQLIDLGENIFDAVVPTAITLIAKNSYSEVLFADMSKLETTKKALDNIPFVEIQQELYFSSPNNIFIQNIRTKKDNEVLLGEILEMKDAGFKYQRTNVGLSQKGKNDLAERIFYSGEKLNNQDVPILIGKDINTYYYNISPNKVLRHNYLSLLNSNESTYFNKTIMNAETKLIWRQTAPYFIGTILSEPIFFGNTIQAGIINETYAKTVDYKYLCALLNSRYLRKLYGDIVKEDGRVFPQVKLEKLKPLPIIIAENQQPYIDLVIQILKQKVDNPQTDTSVLEKQIDQLVYKLYNLTEEEISAIKGM